MSKRDRLPVTEVEKEKFLEEDLFYSLWILFEGAIMWKAIEKNKEEKVRHQQVLAMYTSLVQARLLYEFFSKKTPKDDDAVVKDFSNGWIPHAPLSEKYLGHKKAGNKRLFHLVYQRSLHHGGGNDSEEGYLNKQVLNLAIELFNLTKEFVDKAKPSYKLIIKEALDKAIGEAQNAANFYGIVSVPLFRRF